jgi:hypothetical protein
VYARRRSDRKRTLVTSGRERTPLETPEWVG